MHATLTHFSFPRASWCTISLLFTGLVLFQLKVRVALVKLVAILLALLEASIVIHLEFLLSRRRNRPKKNEKFLGCNSDMKI